MYFTKQKPTANDLDLIIAILKIIEKFEYVINLENKIFEITLKKFLVKLIITCYSENPR